MDKENSASISFHLFPKDKTVRDIWEKFCQRSKNWKPKCSSTICSAHFSADDFYIKYKKEMYSQIPHKMRLKPGGE